jgi:hypothetical protein
VVKGNYLHNIHSNSASTAEVISIKYDMERDLNGEEVWISKLLITYYFNVLSRQS